MSIRPIDMQISIAAMNQNNQAHQQVNQAGANAHASVASIKKDQVQSKETVRDPKDSRKIKSVKEDEDDKKKQNKKSKHEDNDDEELTEEEKKEKELQEKRKKNFVYRLGYNGKLELRPEDTEAENEGAGHIDLKA